MKRFMTLMVALVAVLLLAACGTTKYTVTFDSQGGTTVEAVEVESGKLVERPADPTKEAQEGNKLSFKGWFTDAAATAAFTFDTPIKGNITLYAGWTEELVVSFNTKTSATIAPVLLPVSGGQVTAPAAPTKDGFVFKGWFKSSRGLTWLEPEAVQFPVTVTESLTLHAYYEPLSSKGHNWSDGETYTSSMNSDSVIILNPLTYQWGHEKDFMDMLSTPLYSTEIDWDKAVKENVADYPSDFSKIIAKQYSIDALDYQNILVGATKFPVDSDGDEHLTEDGKYDRDAATGYKDTKWTYHLRDDVKFEDGTKVTAYTYEFTLKQFLDPVQNNYRANSYYRTVDNKNGYPILNAFEYYTGAVTWSQVGFEVIDEYTFTITTFEEISQANAVSFGSMQLVHPAKYTASLTSGTTNSTYGTPLTPYVSYGSYVIKSWDENQKIVFNKNYDYVLKGTINFKSQVIQIVDNEDQKFQLFDQGKLSVAGLTKDYYDEYAERPGVKKSWNGYPQNLMINLAEPTTDLNKVVHPSIMFDKEFRQAMFYGFDRKYYANSVYAPNTASIFPMPGNAKNYMLDALTYGETPQHLSILEKYGVSKDVEGYIPERAQQLFNAAYDRWIAEGNTGPVKLILISDIDEFTRDLVTYIKNSYETLFTSAKFIIEIKEMDSNQLKQETAAWNFDLRLNNVGFDLNTDGYFQYPAIAFNGIGIGGGQLGMTQPYDMSNRHWDIYEPATAPTTIKETISGTFADAAALLAHVKGSSTHDPLTYKSNDILRALKTGTTDEYVYVRAVDNADYWTREVEIDLTNTYNYLVELGEEEIDAQGLTWLYEQLVAADGKEAGIYKGPMGDFIGNVVFSNSDPYAAAMKEPFAGAAQDLFNMIAVFEDVFFDFMPMVPMVARSGATLYADNVVIEWPEYSLVFGWGANRYRYLNTDADFAE